MPTKVKKKPVKPTFTIEQYKELLAGEKKEVVVELPITSLSGSLKTFTARVEKAVAGSEIEGSYTLGFADSVYGSGGYYPPYRRVGAKPKRVLIKGSRPYTDEEYQKIGAKLVATKAARDARDAKKRAADLAKFNALADRLGFETVED